MPKMVTHNALEIGTAMPDGSVFAGLTADGKQQIFAMPTDMDAALTFSDADKAVTTLNANKALGHDDWIIPTQEQLNVLQQNQHRGALNGTFSTKAGQASGSPDRYWSSTEDSDYPSFVHGIRFSDGDEYWGHRDHGRLSCRPVRLVAASAPAPTPR